jgi:hypothetical protein
MPKTAAPKRKLILITGIPGTGKTTYGNTFASQNGFAHYDLEVPDVFAQLLSDPERFIETLLQGERNVVVTWGFLPDENQVRLVKQFEVKGFQLVWFDGNRPAALRKFIRRGTVPEIFLYAQMYRIEESKVVQRIAPIVIDPFNENDEFKNATVILREIEERG